MWLQLTARTNSSVTGSNLANLKQIDLGIPPELKAPPGLVFLFNLNNTIQPDSQIFVYSTVSYQPWDFNLYVEELFHFQISPLNLQVHSTDFQ